MRLVAGLAVLLLASPCAALEEEVRTLTVRPNVTEAYLLIRPPTPAVASVVLFTGSEGVAHVERFKGPTWGEGNFLVRNRRRFAEQGLLVAVIDVPSDHAEGLGTFRASKEHARDVALLLAALRREAAVPAWVVGTSMGTISAANAAARLREGGPDGLVLTASVTRPSRKVRVTVRDLDLDEIRVPTLVVHHESDACVVTPPARARMLTRELTRAPKTAFLEFRGGTGRGDPCEGYAAHGFLGIDDDVVRAIAGWIKAAR